jgi:CelD/BcsL family acetyltransferase involved in cellulose biosynthesis
MSALITDLIVGPSAAFTDLLPEWRALWAQAPDREPFSHPGWVQAYLSAFEPSARPVVLTVRLDGTLVAALPLVRESTIFDGMPVRLLRAPMNPHSFRAQALVLADQPPQTPCAFIDHLSAMPGWDLLTIPRFARSGFADQLGHCAASHGFPILLHPHCPTRYIAIPARALDGGDEPWLADVDPDLRKKMRRAWRQIQQEFRAEPELETCEVAEPADLQRFYDLEASGWKGRAGTAIKCSPGTVRFYTDVAQAFAGERALRLHFLCVQGVTIAGAFSIIAADRLYVLKWSYDEEYARYRPGQLLSGEMLRDCFKRGLRTMDLGEDADYKRAWTPLTQDFEYLYIFNRTLYGRLLYVCREWLRPMIGCVLKRLRRRHSAARPNTPGT